MTTPVCVCVGWTELSFWFGNHGDFGIDRVVVVVDYSRAERKRERERQFAWHNHILGSRLLAN